jgi:hypothetical protein
VAKIQEVIVGRAVVAAKAVKWAYAGLFLKALLLLVDCEVVVPD